MAALDPIRDEIFRQARSESRHEPPDAYAADALVEMARRSWGEEANLPTVAERADAAHVGSGNTAPVVGADAPRTGTGFAATVYGAQAAAGAVRVARPDGTEAVAGAVRVARSDGTEAVAGAVRVAESDGTEAVAGAVRAAESDGTDGSDPFSGQADSTGAGGTATPGRAPRRKAARRRPRTRSSPGSIWGRCCGAIRSRARCARSPGSGRWRCRRCWT